MNAISEVLHQELSANLYTQIEFQHLREWYESGVDQEIIHLNVKSLEGTTPYEYLIYSPKISRRNDGRLRDGDLKKYRHIEHGGWWCSGVDPLDDYNPMMWGCFKPDKPRRDRTKIHKHIKYEHPYKEPTRAFFLQVPQRIWEKIAGNCGIAIAPEDLQNNQGFWHWVWKNNVPVVIVEGAKKAACLLTAGYTAIAIPGINAGYRLPKDDDGNTIGKPFLIPDLKHFATPNRRIDICFDRDKKSETIKNVRTAIKRMGKLLAVEGCEVRVIDLPGPEKGVDDFVVAQGQDTFDELYDKSDTLDIWQVRLFTLLNYQPALECDRPFLGHIQIPDTERLIVLKSAKGTGKTEWLTGEVAKAHEQNRRVLIITHRIQLGEALCDRFGVNYVTEVRDSGTGDFLGYGVCIDSLHHQSQARFNPNDWYNDTVIIDECDQVFWHLLNSGTEVQKRRVSVLKNLKSLIQNVLSSPHGKIYLASADVSDCDVDYVLSLAGEIKVKPFVIRNNYQPKSGNCYTYSGSNPQDLIAALDKAIPEGGHHLLCCSAQKAKSKWGTQALEERFRRKFPDLRILRIDSESVSDPSHPAFGCIAHLNEILTKYDLVIASPSLETGVSIDIKSHFSAVWGIFQGVQSANSVRQMLARLRENVDRHIWVRSSGIGMVGNGSTSVGVLLASQHAAARANIMLLSQADNADYSIDENFQPESLQTWAKRACVINAQMRCYREFVVQGLEEDGYQVLDANKVPDEECCGVYDSVKAASLKLYGEECRAIAQSETISDSEFKKLQDKKAKTKTERYQERKALLKERYGIEVTPGLVEKDDSGWYPQLRLHYFLTIGREQLVERDSKRAKSQIEVGDRAIWKPDFNRGQLLPLVLLLEDLNIPYFLTSGVMFRGSDAELRELKSKAVQHRQIIRNYLGVSVSEGMSCVAIIQTLLSKLGLSLTYVGRFGVRGNRERVYEFVAPKDGRDLVYAKWHHRCDVGVHQQ
ncbi:plasmid replication protein, CyRepA1 family [Calothrix sp. UHCC 0171]|uniref:plasmid replication protein, CyRepA1 family n=1 Tax=Calothrix sp. UHCC 0171 TaxID=3110245 RepID=UPI002B1FCF76|nr:plasmid replication protein, CyRepA1 family [Calothrix sp. UHCC 0171]MEA5573476.1 plasmid replication protein, CyRepA1 family [Calothrix sp. UHCC 0171]